MNVPCSFSASTFAKTALLCSTLTQLDAATEGEKFFTLKIQPLLSEKCFGCHGDDREKIKGDFDMVSREVLLKSDEHFGKDVLIPGDAAASAIIKTAKWAEPDWEMPPKENDRLTEEQIGWLEQWIDLGAPLADEKLQLTIRKEEAKEAVNGEGMIVQTSGGLGDEWTSRRYHPEDIRAFLPVGSDTLVIWRGEFGRTPDNNKRGRVYSLGRGHNVDAMSMLFAGGGVKKGSIVGATDELGAEAVDCVHPIRDVHCTIVHLLGLDDNKLTNFHGGRYKQLSQFGGQVTPEIIE